MDRPLRLFHAWGTERRQDEARRAADALRREAAQLENQRQALLRQAARLEQDHDIPLPCPLCGRRDHCGH